MNDRYLPCSRCGTLRPERHLVSLTVHAPTVDVTRLECADLVYCSRAAGVGKAQLEGVESHTPERG